VLRSLQDSSPMSGFKLQAGSTPIGAVTSPTKTFGGEPTSVGKLMQGNGGGNINIKSEMTHELDLHLDSMNSPMANADAATPPLAFSHPASTMISPAVAAVGSVNSSEGEQFSALPDSSHTVPVLSAPPPPTYAASTTTVHVCKLEDAPAQYGSSSRTMNANASAGYAGTVSVCFSEGGQKRGRADRMTPTEVAFSPSVLPTHKKVYQPDNNRLGSGDAAGMTGRLRKQSNSNSVAICSGTIAP